LVYSSEYGLIGFYQQRFSGEWLAGPRLFGKPSNHLTQEAAKEAITSLLTLANDRLLKARLLNFTFIGNRQMLVVNKDGKRYPIVVDGAWCTCPGHAHKGKCYHVEELKRRLDAVEPLCPWLPYGERTTVDIHYVNPKAYEQLHETEKPPIEFRSTSAGSPKGVRATSELSNR